MRKLSSAGIFAAILALFLFSCEKERSFQDTEPGSGNNGGGANTSGNYYPLTKGSWWKYKDSLTGNISTQTMLDIVKTINNVVYTGYWGVSSSVADTGWAASPKPDYYLLAEGISPNSGASFDLTFRYLNDTASVGYNWRYNAGHGNGFTAYIKTTILERNITKTVLGKSYNNVIHTSLDLSYDVFGIIMEMGTYHFYTAKDIGVIKVGVEFTGGGLAFKSSSDLIDYHIE